MNTMHLNNIDCVTVTSEPGNDNASPVVESSDCARESLISLLEREDAHFRVLLARGAKPSTLKWYTDLLVGSSASLEGETTVAPDEDCEGPFDRMDSPVPPYTSPFSPEMSILEFPLGFVWFHGLHEWLSRAEGVTWTVRTGSSYTDVDRVTVESSCSLYFVYLRGNRRVVIPATDFCGLSRDVAESINSSLSLMFTGHDVVPQISIVDKRLLRVCCQMLNAVGLERSVSEMLYLRPSKVTAIDKSGNTYSLQEDLVHYLKRFWKKVDLTNIKVYDLYRDPLSWLVSEITARDLQEEVVDHLSMVLPSVSDLPAEVGLGLLEYLEVSDKARLLDGLSLEISRVRAALDQNPYSATLSGLSLRPAGFAELWRDHRNFAIYQASRIVESITDGTKLVVVVAGEHSSHALAWYTLACTSSLPFKVWICTPTGKIVYQGKVLTSKYLRRLEISGYDRMPYAQGSTLVWAEEHALRGNPSMYLLEYKKEYSRLAEFAILSRPKRLLLYTPLSFLTVDHPLGQALMRACGVYEFDLNAHRSYSYFSWVDIDFGYWNETQGGESWVTRFNYLKYRQGCALLSDNRARLAVAVSGAYHGRIGHRLDSSETIRLLRASEFLNPTIEPEWDLEGGMTITDVGRPSQRLPGVLLNAIKPLSLGARFRPSPDVGSRRETAFETSSRTNAPKAKPFEAFSDALKRMIRPGKEDPPETRRSPFVTVIVHDPNDDDEL